MSHSNVEKIKERLGIKEVVETYIKLEKSGKNYKGRCPFHNEKTPSFFVSTDRNSYYCFGCGEKGDIFTFVQKLEGTDFLGSLKILAQRAGVELVQESSESNIREKKLKSILEISTVYFENNLKKNKLALEYLKGRGLTEQTITDWRIGFADDAWRNLFDFLSAKKLDVSLISETGMIKKGDKGNYYDTFRSRIMFPIFNSAGDPIAFTGRIFGTEDEKTAKYLNSPETELFKKSEILYGFHMAKNSIRKHDFSILVEGQMDTIMCHQAGYTNTIASSGTALTEKQLEILFRISPKMVIAYDSDSAGFKASERAWKLALSIGFDVKIAPIKDGKDPADVIKDDPKKWKEIVKDSKHIIEVLVDKIKNSGEDDRKIGQMISEKIIPYLAMIKSNIDKAHFVKIIAQNFSLKEEIVYEELAKFNPAKDADTNSIKIIQSKISNKIDAKSLLVERRLFGILEWQKNNEQKVVDSEKINNELKNILADDYENVFQKISGELDEVIFRLEDGLVDEKTIKKEVEELITNLKLKYLVKRRESLLIDLKNSEKVGDDVRTDEILRQIDKISKEIQGINKS